MAAPSPSGKLQDGGQFDDALGMLKLLREKQAGAFRKNLSERMLVYALGRTLGMYDRKPLRQISTQVADQQDRVSALVLAIATVEGEGMHRLLQVGRRKPTTHDAWNNNITMVINTRTQTVFGNVSSIHVVRPQLGVSDKSPLRLSASPGKIADSPERRVFNAQKTTAALPSPASTAPPCAS